MKIVLGFRAKAGLRSWLILSALFGIMGIIIYGVAQYHLIHHNDPFMAETAERVEKILLERETFEPLTQGQLRKLANIERIAIFGDGQGLGLPFYKSKEASRLPVEDLVHRSTLDKKTEHYTYGLVDDSQSVYRIHSRPFQSKSGRYGLIRVSEPLGAIPEIRRALRHSLWLIVPVAVLFLGLASFWITKKVLAPIAEVTRMAKTIQAKGLHERLPHSGINDELGLLVDTLNDMMGRLELSFDTMRRFTADASHELRSPLTTMRSTIDITLGDPRTTAEYVETLESLGEDVNRLSGLTEGLLLLARADADRVPLERTRVSLPDLLGDVLASFHADIVNTDLRLRTTGDFNVIGDERWLRQLFFNLVDNSIKFSKSHNGGTALVEIEVSKESEWAEVMVRDGGPGVPEESIVNLFERFFRVDSARSHGIKTRGYGLGLSIASWIAKVHGGSIIASNRPEGGLQMQIRIPLEPAPA